MAKVDWIAIKTDYLTNDITYQELAAKYGVSFSSIEKKARAEKWRDEKKCECEKIEKEVRKKVSQKVAKKIANRNIKHLELMDGFYDVVKQYIDQQQYKKHVTKIKNYDPDTGRATDEELMDIELDVVNDKSLLNMMSTLEKLQKGQRLAEGLDEKQKLAMDKHKKKIDEERLELDKQRLDIEKKKAKQNEGVNGDIEIEVSLVDDNED